MRTPWFAWLALVLWAVWLYGLQGLLGEHLVDAAWAPDLGLVCLVAWAARTTRVRARIGASLFAAVRAALGEDPLVACLAGLWLVIELEASLRKLFDLEALLGRVSMTVGAAFALALWLAFVAHVRADLPVVADPGAVDFAWRSAVSTGVAAALLGGILRVLPGLRSLEERPWEAGVPLR